MISASRLAPFESARRGGLKSGLKSEFGPRVLDLSSAQHLASRVVVSAHEMANASPAASEFVSDLASTSHRNCAARFEGSENVLNAVPGHRGAEKRHKKRTSMDFS